MLVIRIERIGFFDGRSKRKFPRVWKRDYIYYKALPHLCAPQESKWFLIVARRLYADALFERKISKNLKEKLYLLQGSASSLCTTRIEMIFNRRSKGKFLKIWKRNYIYYKALCWCMATRIERIFDDRSKEKFSRIWKRNLNIFIARLYLFPCTKRIERIAFFNCRSKKKFLRVWKRDYIYYKALSLLLVLPQESKG